MTDHLVRHALGFAISAARIASWFVLLVCIFVPMERLFALHPAKIWRKQVGVDLAWYFINSLVPAAIISVPMLLLARALRGADPGGFYSAVAVWPLWLKIPVVLLVSDIGVYWGHRALHAFPLLWRFHAIHHSAEHLDWLVNGRAHPFDLVFGKLSALIPLYLLGLAQASANRLDPMVALVAIIGTTWTFFIHANVRFRLGPLEWLVSSPAFHHWHHTNDENRDRNFAAMFPLIDRVFGTAWLPKHWPPVYGIDAEVPPTLAGQLLDPLAPQVGSGFCRSGDSEGLTASQQGLALAIVPRSTATEEGPKRAGV
jgi:sterol desaturase/sphingolipid hydroxylase (fatty acid hydroxylase superfamily)